MDIVTSICGRMLGTPTDPECLSHCDRPKDHGVSRGGFRGCSSPALRKYQREATQASREKEKARKARGAAKQNDVDTKAALLEDEGLYEEAESVRVLSSFDKMLDSVPTTPAAVVAQRKERAFQAEVRREEDRVRRLEEERFITECMDSKEFDENRLVEVLVSYLRIREALAPLFRLARGIRMRQGFNRDGIGERELSEQLYGPEQLGMPVELDESVFEIRLGRFLGVTDFRHQLWDKFNRPPTHQVVPPMEF